MVVEDDRQGGGHPFAVGEIEELVGSMGVGARPEHGDDEPGYRGTLKGTASHRCLRRTACMHHPLTKATTTAAHV